MGLNTEDKPGQREGWGRIAIRAEVFTARVPYTSGMIR